MFLKKGKERNLLNGYPWVFANEVERIDGKDKPGSIAKVVAQDGRFVGLGYINHVSKILVRLLSGKDEPIDRQFFYNRIKAANDYRVSLGYSSSYRVVFGESDLLPALIVDKFGDYLSVQFLALGMELRKHLIVDILVELFAPKGIYERSDSPIRLKEGLIETKGVLYGNFNPIVEMEENGLTMFVDLENGQKTGYFLDQKENRDNLKHYVKNKTVLDCFCNVGGFSLCAKKHGASRVVAVDISKTAIAMVQKNAERNNLEVETVVADVFDYLRTLRKDKQKFDVVILDPPAFTKTADTVKEGYRGYKDININGLKLVSAGGYFITCSCSQHLTINLFLQMIQESVFESGVQAKLVELRTQGKDHATLIGTDESLYLKVAVLKVMER